MCRRSGVGGGCGGGVFVCSGTGGGVVGGGGLGGVGGLVVGVWGGWGSVWWRGWVGGCGSGSPLDHLGFACSKLD